MALPQQQIATLVDINTASAYDHEQRWKFTAQPPDPDGGAYTVEDLCGIAELAQDDLISKVEAFSKENGFSYIIITHKDFLEYEHGCIPFRQWLGGYCKTNDLNAHADIAFIGPSLKSVESAKRKCRAKEKEPSKVTDYVRIMPLILKQRAANINKHSLATLERAIKAIENDSTRALARKNCFYRPNKDTGIRNHKTLWECSTPDGDDIFSNRSILAEIKIMHESQMDVDRLTRSFLAHDRNALHFKVDSWDKCVSALKSPKELTAIWKYTTSTDNRNTMINLWGKMLYNYVNHTKGFDRFLDPRIRGTQNHLSIEAIMEIIENDLGTMPKSLQPAYRRRFALSGIFPRESSLGIDHYEHHVT